MHLMNSIEFSNFNELLLLAQSSINQPRDLFVALVAIGLGLNIIYTVLFRKERCFEIATVQMMERNFGRGNARLILICLGSLCVVLGVYLAAQASLRKTASRNSSLEHQFHALVRPEPSQLLSS